MALKGCEHGGNINRNARRWRAVRSAAAVAVVLAAAMTTRSASAYCRTTTCPECPNDAKGCPVGTVLAWQSSCLTFAMQYRASKQIDLAAATDVMEKAFAVWQQESCPDGAIPPAVQVDHHFGTVACNLHEYNQTDANANSIMFRDDVWPYEGSANVLGLTTVTYSKRTGAIYDADIEINATQHLSVEDPVPSTAYDLQSIVTHEAGHFLGMAHSTVLTATMYPQYTAGSQSFRVLDPDDVAGICAVFPPNAALRCDAAPRQGFSPACGIYPSGDGGKCSLARCMPAQGVDDGYRWLGPAGILAGIGLAFRRRRRDQAEGR